MNCTKIEKLLPLYAGGDLAGRQSSEVRAHLSSCDGCRNLAEEFAASRERARNLAVPEFGAEFYEQLRGAVLAEINSRPASRPSVFQSLRYLFAARPAMAASLATLALFGLLSFALYSSLVKSYRTLPVIEQGMANFNLDVLGEGAGGRTSEDDGTSNGARNGQTGFITTTTTTTTARNIARRRSGRTPEAMRQENSAPQNTGTAGSTVAQDTAQADGAAGDETTQQAVARMDIQTSDPNIRIIWLTRKPGE
jgi:hypothetical protein